VAARRVTDPVRRTALCRRAGELLLPAVAPGALEDLKAAAARGRGGERGGGGGGGGLGGSA
jgi:hypothetical protein